MLKSTCQRHSNSEIEHVDVAVIWNVEIYMSKTIKPHVLDMLTTHIHEFEHV